MIDVMSGSAAMSVALESSKFDGLETGGLLLGRKLPGGVRVITRITNGGPNARRSSGSFSPDTDYLNSCIRRAEAEGLDFLGEWHLHPGGFSSPSGGDEVTIKETMEYARLDGFEAVIVNITEDRMLKLFAYHYDSTNTRHPAQVKIVDDEDAEKLMPWFDTQDGKERLLLDSRTMKKRFPTFRIFKRKDQVWWAGEYLGHQIQLVYPADFPSSPLSVMIEPAVDQLKDDLGPKYAVLAAESAVLRIDGQGVSVTAPPAPEAQIEKQQSRWYDSNEGQQEVRKLDGYFRMIFHPVTTFKLPGGEIAFNCGVKDSGDADLIIIFPNDFPDHMPEVRARLGRETSSLEPYPSTKWTGMRSIEAIVKDALAKLREKEKQAKRSKNPRLRSLGRSNN